MPNPCERGNEIDLLLSEGRKLTGVEIKSSSTYHSSFKERLRWFKEHVAPLQRACIVYNGEHQAFSDGIEFLPFDSAAELGLGASA